MYRIAIMLALVATPLLYFPNESVARDCVGKAHVVRAYRANWGGYGSHGGLRSVVFSRPRYAVGYGSHGGTVRLFAPVRRVFTVMEAPVTVYRTGRVFRTPVRSGLEAVLSRRVLLVEWSRTVDRVSQRFRMAGCLKTPGHFCFRNGPPGAMPLAHPREAQPKRSALTLKPA